MYKSTIQIKMSAVVQLLIANVFIFIIQALFPSINALSLNSASWLSEPWTLLTAMFLHGGFAHLLFNMYALFIFGPLIENKIGRNRFLWLYFGSGILASLGFIAYRELIIGVSASALGASGAIMGILGMVIILFPNMKVLFFFIVPMSMRTAGIIFAAIDLFGAFNPTSGIANVAHLVGLGSGLLYGLYLRKKGQQFQKEFLRRGRSYRTSSGRSTSKSYEKTIELTKDDLDSYYKSGRL